MKPRRAELWLLIALSIITAAGYALMGLGRNASVPANALPFLGQLLVLFGIAHFATRRLAPGADPRLLPLAGLLNGLGYILITRLDPDLAALQATWTAFGIAGYVLTLMFVKHSRDLSRYRWTFALIGVLLLVLPLLPGIGRTINGAQLWIRVGWVSLQPGEFAKIALTIFFASYLAEKRELLTNGDWHFRLPDPAHLGPLLLAWSAALLVMVAEKDLGSSLLLFAIFIVMIWVATSRMFYVVSGGLLFALGAWLSWGMFDHVQLRVETWLDPWADPLGGGFQLIQGTFALAAGGLFGTGLGLGDPTRIPAAETDFIFAVIGEELGLLGTTAVLTTFLLLVGAGLSIAIRASSSFSKLMTLGLTAIIGIQAFVIMAGILRVLPLTGITLPFVSYGGSSLAANYVLLALLARVSHENARAKP